MITSRQNAFVKRIKSFRDKKNRDAAQQFVAEGVKSVREAFITGQNVLAVAVTAAYASFAQEFGVKTEILSDDVFAYVSEEKSPQGALAVIAKPAALYNAVTEKCVFLDGVNDPANVGAIIRSAAAFGFNTVLIADGADAYSGKAVRASMGGIFRVKVISGGREELLPLVKTPIFVADMSGEAPSAFDAGKNVCLCIGSEAHGVSERLKSAAAKTVAIPMVNGMESLNAAVSAGILMYLLK